MMLETTSPRGCSEPGGAHFGSPDKDPAVRLRVLEDAGRHNDPVHHRDPGRHRRDRARAGRVAVRDPPAAREYGHVQEVIVQNFRAKPDTAMRARRRRRARGVPRRRSPPRGSCSARGCASRRRRTSPSRRAGPAAGRRCRRLGRGVSPLTPDHVNPERPWPHLDDLARITAEAGFLLRERLTAHPEYVRRRSPGSTRGCCRTSRAGRRRPAWPSRVGSRPGCPGRSPTPRSRRRSHRPDTSPSTPRAAPVIPQRLRRGLRRLGRDRRPRACDRPACAERSTPTCAPRCATPSSTRRCRTPTPWRSWSATARRSRLCARWPTTCAATPSATT
jgi:hypothetical protein